MKISERLEAILCTPEGQVCISGSPGDREELYQIIQEIKAKEVVESTKVEEAFNLLLSNQFLAGKIAVLNTLSANADAMRSPVKLALIISNIAMGTRKAKMDTEEKIKKLEEFRSENGKGN